MGLEPVIGIVVTIIVQLLKRWPSFSLPNPLMIYLVTALSVAATYLYVTLTGRAFDAVSLLQSTINVAATAVGTHEFVVKPVLGDKSKNIN